MANYKSAYTGAEIDSAIGKANTALQEHQKLKTINNESLVGEGDITIEGTSYEAGNNIQISEENVISATDTIYDDTKLREAIAGKQEELISGTNIKTINGNSILGEGNLVIEGGLTSVAHDDTLTGSGTNENPLGINTTKIAQKSDIPAEVTEETVSGWGFTKNTGTYSKPDTGIPKTDLTSDIQTSLEKADTALQEVKTINNKSLTGSGNINLDSYYPAQCYELPTPSQQYVGQIIQYMGDNIVINDENFCKGDFCLGDVYSSAETVYFWTDLTQQRLHPYVLRADVLEKDNIYSYTPTDNYNPATKKYVDDSIKSAITDKLGGSY